MNDIVLNKKTLGWLDAIIRSPSHAILLFGADGSGKSFIANYLAKKLLSVNDLQPSQYFTEIEPEKNVISVESIRNLKHFLSLRTGAEPDNSVSRVVIIHHADKMTAEAQNAVLKTLEEPPSSTVIFLTTANKNSLLDTIVSRVHSQRILNPSEEQLTQFFSDQGYPKDEVLHAVKVSGGRAGLIKAMLDDAEYHLSKSINDVKRILTQNRFERMVEVNTIVKEKDNVPAFIQALQMVSRAAMHASSDRTQTEKWHKILINSLEAEQNLDKKGQPKLVFTDLFLNI